jgi:hypothetical protein
MSGYVSRLVTRSVDPARVLRPAVQSIFEPPANAPNLSAEFQASEVRASRPRRPAEQYNSMTEVGTATSRLTPLSARQDPVEQFDTKEEQTRASYQTLMTPAAGEEQPLATREQGEQEEQLNAREERASATPQRFISTEPLRPLERYSEELPTAIKHATSHNQDSFMPAIRGYFEEAGQDTEYLANNEESGPSPASRRWKIPQARTDVIDPGHSTTHLVDDKYYSAAKKNDSITSEYPETGRAPQNTVQARLTTPPQQLTAQRDADQVSSLSASPPLITPPNLKRMAEQQRGQISRRQADTLSTFEPAAQPNISIEPPAPDPLSQTARPQLDQSMRATASQVPAQLRFFREAAATGYRANAEPAIQVTIGRVEVRGSTTHTAPASTRKKMAGPALEEFLRGRSDRGRA